jgi:chitinase
MLKPLASLLVLTLAAGSLAAAAEAPGAAGFPVIGYYPSWTGIEPNDAQFRKLTHVNYSFINPTPAGGLTEANAALLSRLTALGRKHGVKVCVAVGGWNNGNTSDWEAMAKRPKTRARFTANLLEFCETNGLAGVDIDWEYPNAASARDYLAMMKELGEALHKSGRILTTAVVANGPEAEHIHKELYAHIDYLNIMAYDMNWGRQEKESHSSLGAADSSLDFWLKKGCPREKAVLGLPFYGRLPEAPYRDLIGKDKEAHRKDQVGAIFYNGIPTIKKKTELALQKAAGLMLWDLTQDTNDSTSLLTAIHETVTAARAAAKAGKP